MDILKRKIYVAVVNNNYVVDDWRVVCEHFQLDSDLEMDNLNRVELLLWLEEDFNIELNCNEKDWYTVGDVVESVVQAGGK